jgi:hypothetical protein
VCAVRLLLGWMWQRAYRVEPWWWCYLGFVYNSLRWFVGLPFDAVSAIESMPSVRPSTYRVEPWWWCYLGFVYNSLRWFLVLPFLLSVVSVVVCSGFFVVDLKRSCNTHEGWITESSTFFFCIPLVDRLGCFICDSTLLSQCLEWFVGPVASCSCCCGWVIRWL